MQKKIKLKKVKDAPLLMDFYINGIECIAVVDTGSQISLIDERFAKDCKLELGDASEVGITGACSSKDLITKSFKQPITVETDNGMEEYVVEGITADMSNLRRTFSRIVVGRVVMILGTDFLEKYKAKIHVKQKLMTIDE